MTDVFDLNSLYNNRMNWLTGSRRSEFKHLISQLNDPAKGAHAASALVRMGAESAPALVEAFQARDLAISTQALQVLVRIGPPAIPALAKAVQEAHPLVRLQAVEVLGRIKDRSALPILLDALRGEFYTVRAGAASALAEIGDPQAVPPLLIALKDPEPAVRSAAALALGRFDLPQTFNEVAGLLFDDPMIDVRQAAARALGGTRNPAALPYLMDALHDSFWWFEREDPAADLIQGIQGMGDVAVDPLIKALADTEGAVRRFAAASLGAMRAGRAVDALGMALYDMHHEVGTAAARALGQIGEASLEVLTDAAGHPEPGIRENVALALGGINDLRSGDILLKMLHDPERSVRMQAVRSLGELKDTRSLPRLEELAANRADRELQALARAALDQFKQDK